MVEVAEGKGSRARGPRPTSSASRDEARAASANLWTPMGRRWSRKRPTSGWAAAAVGAGGVAPGARRADRGREERLMVGGRRPRVPPAERGALPVRPLRQLDVAAAPRDAAAAAAVLVLPAARRAPRARGRGEQRAARGDLRPPGVPAAEQPPRALPDPRGGDAALVDEGEGRAAEPGAAVAGDQVAQGDARPRRPGGGGRAQADRAGGQRSPPPRAPRTLPAPHLSGLTPLPSSQAGAAIKAPRGNKSQWHKAFQLDEFMDAMRTVNVLHEVAGGGRAALRHARARAGAHARRRVPHATHRAAGARAPPHAPLPPPPPHRLTRPTPSRRCSSRRNRQV